MRVYVKSIEVRCTKPDDAESPCIDCAEVCQKKLTCDKLAEWIAAGKVVSIQQDVVETKSDAVYRFVPRLLLWGAVAILIVKYAVTL